MSEIPPGTAVTLPATVVRDIYGSDIDLRRRTLMLHLADGQMIETNLINVQLPQSEPTTDPAAKPAAETEAAAPATTPAPIAQPEKPTTTEPSTPATAA